MKTGSTSLAVREMEIKAIMKCTCTHQDGDFFVNKTQCLQRCVEKGTPHIISGNMTYYCIFGKLI